MKQIKYLEDFLLKYANVLIIICWLLSTIVYLHIFGIVSNAEAIKYISQAILFNNTGTFSEPRYWFYCITIFIIAIALKFKLGLVGAFILQSLINVCALLFFHSSLKKIFKSRLTVFTIIIYLLLFWPYQSWVVFLFTESAFFSMILILFSTLVFLKPDSLKNIVIISFALLFVIISRPLGILFIPAVYIFFFYNATRKWKFMLSGISVILFIAAFYIVNMIFSSISDWHITQAFEQESIICDLPTTTPSHATIYLATNALPVYQLFYYVTHNFAHFLNFAIVKLQYFFLLTRPYFSKAHNYFVLLNVVPLYLLAFGSFFITQLKFYRGISLFLATIIFAYTITIIFQCDDYQNRFILSIYPFFVVLAAKSVEYLALNLFKNNKQTSRISVD